MQRLEFANKIQTSKVNQKAEQKQIEEYENKRESHCRNIVLTRKVFGLKNPDTFYVESESTNNLYAFVRYEPYFHGCSCLDNSTRYIKCKHIWGIEYAIMKGTLGDIDKLPQGAKRYPQVVTATKSYRDG